MNGRHQIRVPRGQLAVNRIHPIRRPLLPGQRQVGPSMFHRLDIGLLLRAVALTFELRLQWSHRS